MAKQLEDYMQWPEIEALMYAECGRPETVLGPKQVDKSHVLITAFEPEADSIVVSGEDLKKEYKMTKMDETGYFAVLIPAKKIPSYHFVLKQGKKKIEKTDAYAVDSLFDGVDMTQFSNGIHDTVYEKLGAHPMTIEGVKGTYFAVWAPEAKAVSVVGDFNDWQAARNPMRYLEAAGIYELFVPGVSAGDLYKYEIWGADGKRVMKADPYGNYAERRPATASIVWDLNKYHWKDEKWLAKRKKWNAKKEPMLVYEVALGAFKKPADAEKEFYNYRELAPMICDYCEEMGYTHVELMPIMEHPYDASWGYQVTGYYAPTSRYGTPEDFAYLVNKLHRNKIGVILDWVPAHFPKDAHGLADFDGEALFEYPDPRMGEHPEWGTKVFNYAKSEVKGFLITNALYWIKEFHVDGLRVDAVASMLYLDYGRKDGEWVQNRYGGNTNLDAIEFFKHFNSVIRGTYPGIMTIAEESTAWPNVTGKIGSDSLGFTFKWNMGWMHDFCEYMKLDPYFRKNDHHALTFAMSYNDAEDYILPLSHDEVVHLKCSMVNKMPGYKVDKYANLRVGYTYMLGHSGKKLLFMGQEFGQEREWSEARELDWFLLQNELNQGLQDYVAELLKLYRKYPCMYEIDNSWDGFEWINADDADRSTYSFIRKTSGEKTKRLLFVLNMTPVERKDYCVGVPEKKKYKLVLNSAEKRFGGSGEELKTDYTATAEPSDYKPYRITFDLPAYGALVFAF